MDRFEGAVRITSLACVLDCVNKSAVGHVRCLLELLGFYKEGK